MDTLSLPTSAAAAYRHWARLMLGLDPSVACTAHADMLYAEHSPAIRHVAAQLQRAVLRHLWPSDRRLLYRGLRLEAADLDHELLPDHPAYRRLPALSFTEQRHVACRFADPGPAGFPVLPIPHPVTGRLGLPPNGYVGLATIPASEVLFHWRYLLAVPDLFAATRSEIIGAIAQREVTVRNHPGLALRLHALFGPLGHSYVAEHYPELP
jgi:hypothetical protein